MRVGLGYDVHRLDYNRPLILGGVTIPFNKGLVGHSDADVLVHAIMDALLGALSLGDIGKHFPPSDIKYKNISSLKLLYKRHILWAAIPSFLPVNPRPSSVVAFMLIKDVSTFKILAIFILMSGI